MRSRRWLLGVLGVAMAVSMVVSGVVSADHSWGGYHWASGGNPVELGLGDNVSGSWDEHLAVASGDWNQSSVLQTSIVAGQANVKNCRPDNGRIEVCSGSYGNNGWLGVAQIWVRGEHIEKGSVRVNDFYFALPAYDTPAWRQMVMCQEIGHIFGLDHQDETFDNANLNTCMDYTSDPASNQHPNAHDYEELEAIYEHLDSSGGGGGPPPWAGGPNRGSAPNDWGKLVRSSVDGGLARYELDLGNGRKLITFVIGAR